MIRLDGGEMLAFEVEEVSRAVRQIERGLPVRFVDDLAAVLRLPAVRVRGLLKISPSTYGRRVKAHRLDAVESDRLFRLLLIVNKAVAFFEGNDLAASQWLKAPAPALDGLRPIERLVNEAGVREVEALLGRLEHGVFT